MLFASTYYAGEALEMSTAEFAGLSPSQLVIKGYKSQCDVVMGQLDKLIAIWGSRTQSAIVEGVHLSLKLVAKLMAKYPFIVPFLVRTLA